MRFREERKDEGEGLVVGHRKGWGGGFGEVLLGVDFDGRKESPVPLELMSWRFVWATLSCSTTSDDLLNQLFDDGLDVSYDSYVRSFVVVELLSLDVYTEPFDFSST